MRDSFVPAAEAVKAEFPREFEKGPIMWSYDNASIHLNQRMMGAIGMDKQDRLPLPPLSGDMHKVIEHVHPRLCEAMKLWVMQQGKVLKPQQYMDKMAEIFFKIIKPEQIANDCKSLPATYREVVKHQGKNISKKALK
jgi:hypothetical protein